MILADRNLEHTFKKGKISFFKSIFVCTLFGVHMVNNVMLIFFASINPPKNPYKVWCRLNCTKNNLEFSSHREINNVI